MNWSSLAIAGASVWLIILLLPWRPWDTRQSLDSPPAPAEEEDLSHITVLIPARNEAEVIEASLSGLLAQGAHLDIILIDDASTDSTARVAEGMAGHNLRIIPGEPPPAGWSGKLWALEQGIRYVDTPLLLLMDADIELGPGILAELRNKMKQDGIQLISLMAGLRMVTFWERLLMPAFIFFFKLIYPFRLSNSAFPGIAAAAGGCILMEKAALDSIGGFKALRGHLIDDCALAKRVKSSGYRTWIGLTHSAKSLRPYNHLMTIWKMVARTAFTQLHYSTLLLLLCTALMILAFWVPVLGLLLFPSSVARIISLLALACMALTYLPTLKFYRLSGWWAAAMPLIGTLYLAMTWSSAIWSWQGKGSNWKDRSYLKNGSHEISSA
ncbi:MAG: glycosyltransferase [Pseudomonadota bacterium]